jgi:L-threonylcarbamoyladenylate synthase
VASIFAAKQRPQFNPLISHIASIEAAFRLGQFSGDAEKLAAAFWPGPLTIVIERRRDCPISFLCSAGLSTVALRVPNHPVAQELLQEVNLPIAAPSANRSGRISPTTADHVKASLGEAVDMIVDGGPCGVGVESTVVRFIDNQPYLLRSGGVTREALDGVLNRPVLTPSKDAIDLHSPGMLESHYAPQAALRLNVIKPEDGEAFIGFGDHKHGPFTLSQTGNLQEAAANLFKLLHHVDDSSPQRIAVAPIPMTGLGEAINDRLTRAAAPRPKS